MELVYKDKSGVTKTQDIKDPFRKYKGLDIQYLNRQYSKLTPNVSGRNVSKDKWEEKLQVLYTELPGLRKLHKKITERLPYYIQKISVDMSNTYVISTNLKGAADIKKAATFYNRVTALCGSEVLDAYFYAMQQCRKKNKWYSVGMFLTDVPLDIFFYIVFIKHYNIIYRQKWGLYLNVNKLLPVPIDRSIIECTEQYASNFNIIASKMAKICINNFNGKWIKLGLDKAVKRDLVSLCNDLITGDESTIKEKINLNTSNIPCVDIFLKLDKTNLFYTKDEEEI